METVVTDDADDDDVAFKLHECSNMCNVIKYYSD